MDIAALLESLKSSGIATSIRASLYWFPLIESFHVVGLTIVFGTIAIVDLRLLGLASANRPFTRVVKDTVKWTWVAFVLTVTTGFLMFITNAPVYYLNPQFRYKMALIALAGINMLIFELTTGRTAYRWDSSRSVPAGGKLAGALSLVLWISVIFMGRWIGFTTTANLPAPTETEEINVEDIFGQ